MYAANPHHVRGLEDEDEHSLVIFLTEEEAWSLWQHLGHMTHRNTDGFAQALASAILKVIDPPGEGEKE